MHNYGKRLNDTSAIVRKGMNSPSALGTDYRFGMEVGMTSPGGPARMEGRNPSTGRYSGSCLSDAMEYLRVDSSARLSDRKIC